MPDTFRQLTVYRLQSHIQTPSEALRSPARATRTPLSTDGVPLGELWYQRSKTTHPPWVALLDPLSDQDLRGALSGSTYGAVWFIYVGGVLYALTFGPAGHQMLERTAIEHRFGLRTTLNAVDPKRLRHMERRVFDEVHRVVDEQAARDATTFNFGVDTLRDLVRAVSGSSTSEDNTFLAGATSLRAWRATTPSEVPTWLTSIDALWQSDAYKTGEFAWIENFSQVTDPSLRTALVEELDMRLADPGSEGLSLALPEGERPIDHQGFSFGRRKERHRLLRLDQAAQDLKGLSWKKLKARKLNVHHADGRREPFPLHRCLTAELQLHDAHWVLELGEWYRVRSDLIASMDADLARWQTADLPAYDGDVHTRENDWCVACAEELGMEVTDKKLIYVHKGKLEFCDLYDGTNLVFAKRFHSSQSVSHLFTQVRGTTQLWTGWEPDFRVAVNDMLPEGLRLEDAKARPAPGAYRLVLAILERETPLPLLTRINLWRLLGELEKEGYEVAYKMVPGVQLTKCPSGKAAGA